MRNIAFETPCAFQKIQKVLAEKTLEQTTEIINTIAWVRDTRSEWNYRFCTVAWKTALRSPL